MLLNTVRRWWCKRRAPRLLSRLDSASGESRVSLLRTLSKMRKTMSADAVRFPKQVHGLLDEYEQFHAKELAKREDLKLAKAKERYLGPGYEPMFRGRHDPPSQYEIDRQEESHREAKEKEKRVLRETGMTGDEIRRQRKHLEDYLQSGIRKEYPNVFIDQAYQPARDY